MLNFKGLFKKNVFNLVFSKHLFVFLRPIRIGIIPIVAGSFLWTNCANNSDFSGSNSKKEAEKKARRSKEGSSDISNGSNNDDAPTRKSPVPPKVTKSGSDSDTNEVPSEPSLPIPEAPIVTTNQGPEGKIVVPEVCNPTTGATFANLLTPIIYLDSPTSEIVYEISSTDCEGKLKTIQAESIAFDFDGVLNRGVDTTSTQLKYRLVAEGTSYSGVLIETIGEDLFGSKGANYFFFQTTQKVSTSTTSKTIRLAISVAGKSIQPRVAPAPGSVMNEFTLKSFLRFGSTAPVTKPLTFKMGPPK